MKRLLLIVLMLLGILGFSCGDDDDDNSILSPEEIVGAGGALCQQGCAKIAACGYLEPGESVETCFAECSLYLLTPPFQCAFNNCDPNSNCNSFYTCLNICGVFD